MTQPQEKKTASEEKGSRKYSFFVIIISVLAAVILWFYVQETESPNYKKTFHSIPVQFQSLSSSFSLIDGGELTADITLVGKRSDLNKIKDSDLEVYGDLSDVYQPGSHFVTLEVMTPSKTELGEIYPQTASIFVDTTTTAIVPVRVDVGKYTVPNGALEITPVTKEITIKGPKSLLEKVSYAKAAAGELGVVTANFESNLSYGLYDADGNELDTRYLTLPVQSIRVKFSLYQTKEVPLTVACKNGYWSAQNMEYTVEPAIVLIKGDPALLEKIESVPAVILDETKLDSDTYVATLMPHELALTAGVSLAETIGDVKVSLSLRDNTSRRLRVGTNSARVIVEEPAEGLSYRFEEAELVITVRGSSATIGDANISQFHFNVDLSEFTQKGTYTVPVETVQDDETKPKYYMVGQLSLTVVLE